MSPAGWAIWSALGFSSPFKGRASTPPPSGIYEARTPTHGNRDCRPVMDTPVSRNENSAQALGFESDDAKSRYRRMVDEAEQTTLGPMPIQEFLTVFLPLQDETVLNDMPSPLYAFRKIPESPKDESEIYDPLILSMNGEEGQPSRCPGIIFMNTSNRVEYPNKRGSMKPDVCGYTEQYTELVQVQGTTSKGHTQMGYADLFFEIKKLHELDFFSDPPPGSTAAERQTFTFVLNRKNYSQTNFQYAKDAFGQNVAYATEICARQHRCFCFSVSLAGPFARFIRWDRAGAIATESFNIREHPEYLCEFLWRYSHVSDQGRGYDMTVQMATKKEEALFKEAISRKVEEQLGPLLEKSITDYDKLTKRKKKTSKRAALEDAIKEHYKAGVVTAVSMTGPDCGGASREVLYHGDILYEQWGAGYGGCEGMSQLTRTHEFRDADWVCGQNHRVVKHAHYRLVEGTVGYGLERFSGTNELLHATYDVFQCMLDAYNKDQRIHRDVSLSNIILHRDGTGVRRGYLVDWELSCRPDLKGEARDYWRTVSYISSRVLENQLVQHSLQDDMESMLYVVLYCSLRWLPHSLSADDTSRTIQALFEPHSKVGDSFLGGFAKSSNMFSRTFMGRITFKNSILHEWLNTVMNYHHPRAEQARRGQICKWDDPRHLDTFWGDLLKTSALPEDDKVDHHLPNSPRDPRRDPYEPTLPSKSLGKRKKSQTPSESQVIECNGSTSIHPKTSLPRGRSRTGGSNSQGSTNEAEHRSAKRRPQKKIRIPENINYGSERTVPVGADAVAAVLYDLWV
ncbi:hypothetical protein A0H81_08673 [Grifola frondosa]|uniref:Fungal-type protein kinase domain-containing protein n=1 Tax=Grifola frondosa TaxID=5627 RepID=A0A1C7M470_GRIFR|nr:hypothetical protein A0H81_08673 [Grifola frondosa]